MFPAPTIGNPFALPPVTALVYPSIAPVAWLTNADTVDKLVFDTASAALAAGEMGLLGIEHSSSVDMSPQTVVGDPAGAAVAFTKIGDFLVLASNNRRLSIWRAVSPFTGLIRITFPGATVATGIVWSGCKVAVSAGWAPSVVQVGAGATGNSTTPAATALAAFSHANNACVAWNSSPGGNAITPAESFAELGDQASATPTNSLQLQWATNDPSSTATMTSGNWGAIALELGAVAA